MGNLLDPLTGTIHADVNKDHAHDDRLREWYRRALCNLQVAVSDRWRDVQGDKVTCPDCQFRIDAAMAAAYGDYDPTDLLSYEMVAVALALRGIKDSLVLLQAANYIAKGLYPDDMKRQERFIGLAARKEG